MNDAREWWRLLALALEWGNKNHQVVAYRQHRATAPSYDTVEVPGSSPVVPTKKAPDQGL
jgi:hypothetical protein